MGSFSANKRLWAFCAFVTLALSPLVFLLTLMPFSRESTAHEEETTFFQKYRGPLSKRYVMCNFMEEDTLLPKPHSFIRRITLHSYHWSLYQRFLDNIHSAQTDQPLKAQPAYTIRPAPVKDFPEDLV